MQRTPEPQELMDEREQALAYASANFSEANNLFAELLHQLRPAGLRGRALDLGCGPADIPLALLRQHPDLHIDAVDGARAMLEIARRHAAAEAPLEARLSLICEHLPSTRLAQSGYSLVLSNSLLHHLSDPNDLWLTVKRCAIDNAAILIMDLARPPSHVAVDTLVETYAANEPQVLREDFRNSLHAAYTPGEVQQQLLDHGMRDIEVSMVSDRHWAARGNYTPAA